MVLVAPQQASDAPPRVPASYGLFTAVTPSPAPGGVRWENGLTWTDAACGPLPAAVDPDCAAPSGLPLEFTSGQAAGTAVPFTVYGEFECSPVGWTPEAAQAAATAQLTAREEEAVGSYLIGLLTAAPGESAPLTGDSITAATAGTTPVAADLAALEGHLAASYGSRGVVLASLPALYNLASDAFAVIRQGNSLITAAGTPVAVVRTAPVGFSLGIIPAPLLVRGDPFPGADPAVAGFDHSQNNMRAVAMRSYAAGWTEGCGAAYIALS